MPRKEGTAIEKCHARRIGVHDFGGRVAGNYGAKNAVRSSHHLVLEVCEHSLMPESSPVSMTSTPGESILPLEPAELRHRLAQLGSASDDEKRNELAKLACEFPASSAVWALLAAASATAVERYAFARVGYHRGLDAARKAGWRGSGYIRWKEPSNRGLLASIDALRIAAAEIGESEEVQRCALFLRQLDPEWPDVESNQMRWEA